MTVSSWRMILPVLALVAGCHGCGTATGLTLTENGRSAYAIYYDAASPGSVKLAAEELQRVLELSTGVKLPVAQAPVTPMICLGDNAASRKAGFSAETIPAEGFRIVTHGENVYIIGKDWPDADKTWDRCDSTGTLFGVYDFLERVAGVRWLMPGPLGEDVPAHRDALRMAAMDLSDAPMTLVRALNCSPRGNPEVAVWLRRNRTGRSIAPSWGHNFALHPPTDVLLAHPEYMPLQKDGLREKPIGNRAWGSHEHKFCLSSPGLIQAFGDSLVASLDKNPRRFGESMAPADGGHWCICPECRKLVITDTTGPWGDFPPYGRSTTPLVVNFYNGVARVVAKKYPERWVGGLAYHDYLYPPPEGVKLDPNVFIAIAINAGYGYKFYKPETAARVGKVIAGWSNAARNLGWTDYSTWMRNPCSAPLPPGLSILKTTFSSFGKSLKVINYQSQEVWGTGAAHNYVVARLMWRTDADVESLYREFLARAYGPAAPTMEQLYAVIDESLSKYIVSKPYPDHEIWYETAERVYAPIYDKVEQLYLQALGQTRTEMQRKRLEMFADALVVLHWNLRHAGLLKDGQKSPMYRADADFDKFLEARKGSLLVPDYSIYEKYRWQTMIWSPEKRALEIRPLPAGVAAPKVDGVLGDAAWKSAAKADIFRANEKRREAAKWQTTAWVTFDRDNLYVAYECAEDEPQKVRRECKIANSDSILKDDVVELYLQLPGGARDIRVNAAGTSWVTGKAGAVTSAAAVAEKSWIVELAIPFKSLDVQTPAAGSAWRGNFTRRRVGPPIELSSWSRVEDPLGDPRAFGELRFTK